MKLFDRVKKSRNDKGFTLVELIVVLVILAILAAILVPALLGYIDRARESQIVLNAKSALTAAQAEMSQLYGEGKAASDANITGRATTILETADVVTSCEELIIGTAASAKDKTAVKENHNAYIITYVKYTQGGKTIYFNGTSWVNSVAEATAPTVTYTIKAATPTP